MRQKHNMMFLIIAKSPFLNTNDPNDKKEEEKQNVMEMVKHIAHLFAGTLAQTKIYKCVTHGHREAHKYTWIQ